MSPGPTRSGGATDAIGERWIFLGTAALAVAVTLAYGPGRLPLLEDNQHYFYMAERFADGVPPHVSNFDPKNMLSVLLTGLGIEAGRWAGISDVAASRVVSVAALAGAVGLLALFARRVVGSATAGVVTALVLGSVHYLPLMAGSGSRPKVFLLLFMAASLFFLTRDRWGAAAVAASLAFLTWQPALLVLGSVLAARWLADRDPRALAAPAVAAAVPVAAYEGYFAAAGALSEQLTQAYVFPARYMTGHFDGVLESLSDLRRFWDWGYSVDAVGIDLTWVVPALFAGASVVWAARIRRWIAETDAPWRELRRRPALVHFGLSMVGAFVFTWWDATGAPDFFFVFPYVAVTIGGAAALVVRRADRASLPRAGHALAAGLAGLLLFVAAAGAREARLLPVELEDQRRLGERVGGWMASGRSVYAAGAPHLLAFNRAANWTRYSFFFRGLPAYLRARTGSPVFVPRREGELPDVVLTSRSLPPGWPGWLVGAGYRQATDSAFARQDIRVWRRLPGRRGAGGTSPPAARDRPAAP